VVAYSHKFTGHRLILANGKIDVPPRTPLTFRQEKVGCF